MKVPFSSSATRILLLFCGYLLFMFFWQYEKKMSSVVSGKPIAHLTDEADIWWSSTETETEIDQAEIFHKEDIDMVDKVDIKTLPLDASIHREIHLPHGEKDLYNVEAEQEKRKEHLEEACDRLKISRDLPPVSWEKTFHFLVSDKYKFLFCFAPKVSCTTWKGIMSTLYRSDASPEFKMPSKIWGVPTKRKERFLKMSDIRDAHTVLQRWMTYRKVTFVREPLERALSAYLDKFVYGRDRGSFERKFGSIIVRKYRKIATSKLMYPLKDKIKFDEFIRFITDRGPESPMTQQTDHWLPLSRITSPCQIKYDFIGHYETLQMDAPYVLNYFNLSQHVTFPDIHPSRSHDNLIKAYSDVPVHLIYRLVDYYRPDYELFGYSANETLKIILSGRRR